MRFLYMVVNIIILHLFFLGCIKTHSYEEEEMFTWVKGEKPCSFSLRDLNRVFENRGFGKNSLSNPSITVVNKSLIVKDNDNLYKIDCSGNISLIPKPFKCDYYVNRDFKAIALRDFNIGVEWERWGEVRYDRNARFIGYNYSNKNNKAKRYRIIEIKTKKVILDHIGYLSLLEASYNELFIFVLEKTKNGFDDKFYRYNIYNPNKKHSLIIQKPKNLYDGLAFSSTDIDIENNLIAFSAYYYSPKFSFQKSLRTQMWVYDIKKDEYIYRRTFNRGGGDKVFFIPDSLCDQLRSY